ncbi:uncharacterized protein AMSG_04957 [Thecamonas trahens ATCC 50062]|uniref:Uncharacterized protein n=1 Tax=Thecamonas trahens ATCC 50062 TaxID=461836 RepID=A0A0L0DB38_THETB|nr:hypothetical protein AMSG_04957 [Thecamonas trahens ATCC 50062]KNC48513.1 hypothetical protein AMSG_04957 [Thecamonas trahens ATCC 50062]|eukprot:XP_013758621.1 hypothetical protein AMSG_04957 [Thecamonas trahens ATCC 50062]
MGLPIPRATATSIESLFLSRAYEATVAHAATAFAAATAQDASAHVCPADAACACAHVALAWLQALVVSGADEARIRAAAATMYGEGDDAAFPPAVAAFMDDLSDTLASHGATDAPESVSRRAAAANVRVVMDTPPCSPLPRAGTPDPVLDDIDMPADATDAGTLSPDTRLAPTRHNDDADDLDPLPRLPERRPLPPSSLMDRLVASLGLSGVGAALGALVVAYLLSRRLQLARSLASALWRIVRAFLSMIGGDTLADGRKWLV